MCTHSDRPLPTRQKRHTVGAEETRDAEEGRRTGRGGENNEEYAQTSTANARLSQASGTFPPSGMANSVSSVPVVLDRTS